MRSVKDKGLEELRSFRGRLYKSRGMERISFEDFKKIAPKVEELIDIVEEINEEDEGEENE